MSSPDSPPNRTALVTGGTRGIGRGIVLRLAADGFHVVLTGRDTAAGRAVADEVAAAGGSAAFHPLDLLSPDDITRVVAGVAGHRLDVLVHNAGIYPEHPLKKMSLEDWNLVIHTNLSSAMLLLRECAAPLAVSGAGRVVMTSSITGPRTVIAGLAHYAASKGGLDALVRSAAVELAADGITVNAVAPGSVMTESLAELYAGPGELAEVERRIPVGRIGTPADIAAVVSFLARPDAGFVTGQIITADGGQTLPEVQA